MLVTVTWSRQSRVGLGDTPVLVQFGDQLEGVSCKLHQFWVSHFVHKQDLFRGQALVGPQELLVGSPGLLLGGVLWKMTYVNNLLIVQTNFPCKQ